MLAPKGFTQHISKDAYVAAQTTASSKNGVLRYRLPLMLLTAAFLFGGFKNVFENGGLGYLLTGLLLLVFGFVCAVVVFYAMPKQVKTVAERDYVTFDALSNPAQVVFDSDEMLLKSDMLSRRVEYAKTRLCIETNDRFVILTDDDATVVLEKACFEQAEDTTAFLRDVFARWYKRG